MNMDMNNDISASGAIISEEDDFRSGFTGFETLHEGRFSRIMKARRQGRWWVLKGLPTELQHSPAHLNLLRKEFGIMSSMQHPGIVMAVSLEEVSGYGLCIIMEWIDGVTLKEWLRSDHSPAERMRIARQLMDTLEHVHSLQTAHRDLKPSNILVTRSGANIKLIDFGFSDTDSSAVFKQPAGTDGYMSPEQASARQTDVRNDIYSLGCIFEEMGLGRKYAGIVRKCKRPLENRFGTVSDVRRALNRITVTRRWAGLSLMALLAACIGYLISDIRTQRIESELNTIRHEQQENLLKDELHASELAAAIAEGKHLMDEIIAGIDPTAMNENEINAFLGTVAPRLTAIWESYPQSLAPEFTETERESVRSALATHWTDLMKPFRHRLSELASDQ